MLIAGWRFDPEAASEHSRSGRVEDDRVDAADWKLLEDLYAKCFSWISGRREDNEIIPIGQPCSVLRVRIDSPQERARRQPRRHCQGLQQIVELQTKGDYR